MELAGRETRLRWGLNTGNSGFAGGNNNGTWVSSGNVLVLLNNDTQVNEGWLAGIPAKGNRRSSRKSAARTGHT